MSNVETNLTVLSDSGQISDQQLGGHSEISNELNLLCNAFLIIRVIYNIVYILAFNIPLSTIRSAVWTVGLAIIFRIFTLALLK